MPIKRQIIISFLNQAYNEIRKTLLKISTFKNGQITYVIMLSQSQVLMLIVQSNTQNMSYYSIIKWNILIDQIQQLRKQVNFGLFIKSQIITFKSSKLFCVITFTKFQKDKFLNPQNQHSKQYCISVLNIQYYSYNFLSQQKSLKNIFQRGDVIMVIQQKKLMNNLLLWYQKKDVIIFFGFQFHNDIKLEVQSIDKGNQQIYINFKDQQYRKQRLKIDYELMDIYEIKCEISQTKCYATWDRYEIQTNFFQCYYEYGRKQAIILPKPNCKPSRIQFIDRFREIQEQEKQLQQHFIDPQINEILSTNDPHEANKQELKNWTVMVPFFDGNLKFWSKKVNQSEHKNQWQNEYSIKDKTKYKIVERKLSSFHFGRKLVTALILQQLISNCDQDLIYQILNMLDYSKQQGSGYHKNIKSYQ